MTDQSSAENHSPAGSRESSDTELLTRRLEASEARLRLAMEAAGEGFWEFDIPADVVYFDAAGARMIGYEPDEIRDGGEAWVERIHPEDRLRVAAAVESCLGGQCASFNEEYRLQTKSGDYLWIAGSGNVERRDERGNPLNLIGINRNIDTQKRNEMATHQARRLEAIGSLAGGIAHEFNNILAIILGAAEVSANEIPSDHPAAEFLEEIRLTSLRGRNVVKQLLEYSGSNTEEQQETDALAAIRGAMKMLRASIPHELKIREKYSGGRTVIHANATQIQQIIINLVKNAADACSLDTGRITLAIDNVHLEAGDQRLTEHMPPGDYFRLAVTDNGQGIPPEQLPRVFDPYFTTKEQGQGTGMGLSVVQRIVADHGGSLHLESRTGRGTTVRVHLPLCPTDQDPRAELAPSATRELLGHDELVALVDDEPAFVKYTGLSLERLGFRVEGFAHAKELLAAVRRNPTRFAAVVSDLSMPQMRGDRLLVELKRLSPGLPAILCSGYSEAMAPERAAELGAAALMRKPFDGLDLARTLRRVIDGA